MTIILIGLKEASEKSRSHTTGFFFLRGRMKDLVYQNEIQNAE